MSVRADSQTLQQIPLFRDCDPVALQILAFAAERQEFASGEDIITKGKKARAAFLILNGQAKLRDEGEDLGLAEPGSMLGEVAMLRAGTYAITATASGPVETVRLSHELFIRVAKEYPDFGRAVMRNLGDKLAGHLRELDAIRLMLNKSRNFSDLG
ncbi:MAG: cyclic nucleotide-binding domain-containing protein [Alphaproteobacteria bacterium]|nr:cyclic nucleotide-binding domain-containing protein [Alphaproteobacteria bacterium]